MGCFKRLCILILFGFFLRICIFIWAYQENPECMVSYDTESYHLPALSILEKVEFNRSPDSDEAEFFRTPGFPLILAGFYKLFGVSYIPFIVFQMVVGALIIPMLAYHLGKMMFNETAGFLSAILLLFDPNLSFLNFLVLSETLNLLLVLMIATICYKLLFTGFSLGKLIFLSLIIVISIFVRPIAILLPLCIVVGILITKKWNDLWTWRQAAIAAFVLLVFPWGSVELWKMRNEARVGTDQICGVSSINMLKFRAAGVYAMENDISFGDAFAIIQGEMLANTNPEDNIHDRRMEYGVNYIKEHPFTYFKMVIYKIPKMLLGAGLAKPLIFLGIHDLMEEINLESYKRIFGQLITERPIVLFWIGYFGFFVLILNAAFFLGALNTLRHISSDKNWIALLCILGILAYFIFMSAGPEANARFRASFSGIYSIVAGYGAWCMISYLKKSRIAKKSC